MFYTAAAYPPPLHGSALLVCCAVCFKCSARFVCEVAIVRIMLVTKTVAFSIVALKIICIRALDCILVYYSDSETYVVLLIVVVCILPAAKTAAVSMTTLTACMRALTCTNLYRSVRGTSIVKYLRVSQCTTVYSYEYCVSMLNHFGTVTAPLSWFQTVLSGLVFCVTALHIPHFPCIAKCNLFSLCAKARNHTSKYNGNILLLCLSKYMKYFYVLVCAILTYTFICCVNVSIVDVQGQTSRWGRRDKQFIVFVISFTLVNMIYLLIHKLNWIFLQIHELALFKKQLIFND